MKLPKRNQKGVILLAVVPIIAAMAISTTFTLFEIMTQENKRTQQTRVVESIDRLFSSFSSYFVYECNQGSNPIPVPTVSSLESDKWHLFPIVNPSNATITLDLERPTVVISHTDRGSRELNQSSTILRITMAYPSDYDIEFRMFLDALGETNLVFSGNTTTHTVVIEDQVINRRLASELLDEAVFNQRSCI